MIFVQWPLMVAALIPVIVVEVLVIRRWLPLSPRQAFTGIGKANLYSTVAGVPLAWGIMFLVEMAIMLPLGLAAMKFHWTLESPISQVLSVIVGAAWEGPVEGQLYWIIPLAVTVLLVPSFFVSVRLERRSCLQAWPAADPVALHRGVYVANLWSYGFLFFICLRLDLLSALHT